MTTDEALKHADNNSRPLVEEDEYVFEIDIHYDSSQIEEKLTQYQVDTKTLFKKLTLDLNAIKKIHNANQNTHLLDLSNALQHAKRPANLNDFTRYINQLIFLWLSALEQGNRIQSVMQVLTCLKCNTFFDHKNTQQLHLFLFDLVAETAQQHQQQLLNYALNFDQHTHLPNLYQLNSHIALAVKKAYLKQEIALISIQFLIAENNPVLLANVSSQLNQLAARVLKNQLLTEMALFHSGNLQFEIFIPQLNHASELNLMAAKIGRAFEAILQLTNQSVLLTPYIGSAIQEKTTNNTLDLVKNTKLALESAIAKQQHFVLYSEFIEAEIIQRNTIESKVLEAFSSDSLSLFFQPIVNLDKNSCAGAELLLRWDGLSANTVYPTVMIEILNKAGKGKLFTRWLINSACRYASELIHTHNLPVYLTLNLRAEDLYDVEVPHLLLQAVALWSIKPQDILLEITENGALEYNENSSSVIKTLSESGFRLALDDFGTGFSSLSRLRTMPIDLIKIDQSFVRDIKHSTRDFNIVKSIALLAYSLGKEVLAEGVEDADCLELIKRMNIQKCQGYYFAKPMPFEAFINWAKQHP